MERRQKERQSKLMRILSSLLTRGIRKEGSKQQGSKEGGKEVNKGEV